VRAVETLKFWAQQFPDRKPEHYVFPLEKCNAAGFDTDPTHPIGDVKEAWEGAKRRTRRHCPICKVGLLANKEKPAKGYRCLHCKAETEELPAGLVSTRFHDLRHTAVTRMINAGVPLPRIARIVGWAAGTLVMMARRYGHFRLEELRADVEAISRNSEAIEAGYPHFSPHLASQNSSQRAN
jgi:integrase